RRRDALPSRTVRSCRYGLADRAQPARCAHGTRPRPCRAIHARAVRGTVPTGPSGADAAPEPPERHATLDGARWHPAGTPDAVLQPQVSGAPTYAVQG